VRERSLIPVVVLYLVIGALVKWKVYGAEPLSWDIIPNVGFWSALPFLVKVPYGTRLYSRDSTERSVARSSDARLVASQDGIVYFFVKCGEAFQFCREKISNR